METKFVFQPVTEVFLKWSQVFRSFKHRGWQVERQAPGAVGMRWVRFSIDVAFSDFEGISEKVNYSKIREEIEEPRGENADKDLARFEVTTMSRGDLRHDIGFLKDFRRVLA